MRRVTQVQLAITLAAVSSLFYIRLSVFPRSSPFELFLLLNIAAAVFLKTPATLACVVSGLVAAHVLIAVEGRVPSRYATMTIVYLVISGILLLLNHRWHQAKDRAEVERAAHEQQRERLLAEAQDANRAKDRLLANVSHELRTPLTAISGWALMLTRGNLSPGEVQRAAAVIGRNADALAKVVDDLLDVSLAIARRVRLDPTTVPVGPTVGAAVESMLPAAAARGITLRQAVPADVGTIRADRQRFQQVLLVVLSNAVKFTPSGGEVTIDATAADGLLTIAVSDTGIGIEPDFLPRVFDRFSQADSSPTRSYGGTGLGLAIAKELTELMGGGITVTSQGKERGTTVSIRFPLEADSAIGTVANP